MSNTKLQIVIDFLFKPTIKEMFILVVFSCVIVLIAFVALNKIETQTKLNSQHALSTVLITTQETLHLWIDERKRAIEKLAEEKTLLKLTEELLSSSKNPEKLINSSALIKMREFFQENLNFYEDEGFFIISPDMISISSMRDSNIGTINLIYIRKKQNLIDTFNGKTNFVSTITSDVALYDREGVLKENLPTQFFLTPILNKQKKIIAALAIRIDPAKTFSRIIQLGRIGQTGETYAFDEKGTLISESCFDEQLKTLRMVEPDKYGIGNILITDPGGNLLEGYISPKKNKERQLTVMAKNAVAGRAGFNTDGYRDYRGVMVFGAWLWNDHLDFGVTTEIDREEALKPYYLSRIILLSVLGFVIIMIYLLLNMYRVSEKQKLNIFTATVSMTQHILNNLLNQMQLFQMEAERVDGFAPDIKKLMSESIVDGDNLVKKLSSVTELDEDNIRNSVYKK